MGTLILLFCLAFWPFGDETCRYIYFVLSVHITNLLSLLACTGVSALFYVVFMPSPNK